MLDSVNLVQFKKAFQGSLSDMLVITEACVEKNKSLMTGTGVISLSKSVILNDDSFFKSCGNRTARTLVLSGLIKREFLQYH